MSKETDGISHESLEAWFLERVPGLSPPLHYELIHGGMSNLTYLVSDQEGSRWVLRRPPLGKRLASAHDMGREVKIVTALAGTDVPVPPVVGYCEDEDVTGAPFYVMEFVEGPVLRSPDQVAQFPEEQQRRDIGLNLVDTLAKVHAVDPDAVGLGDLGRKEGYAERQLKRWQGQWEKSKTRELPAIDEVHEILQEKIPEQGPATIVHGDYRLDNVIYNVLGEVAAVVDWELCTLGDPLADLGLLCVYWRDPGDGSIPFMKPATIEPGFPRKAELVERYAEVSGRDVSHLDFFIAMGMWKLAVICEGVYARFSAGAYGSDGSDGGADFDATVHMLASGALETARKL